MSEFRPGAVDYERQASSFEEGRALSDDALNVWRDVAERWIAPLSPNRILDLGSGTGRFSPRLAEWLHAEVVGIEPSDGMRATAGRENSNRRVEYLSGDAQRVPLEDGSCDAAWLMHVIHHVGDRLAAARELARVIRKGGRVLVMGAYSERRRELRLFHYFPASLRVIDRFPLAKEIIADFEGVGFQHVASDEVEYVSTTSIAEAVERTRLRADSTLH